MEWPAVASAGRRARHRDDLEIAKIAKIAKISHVLAARF